MDVQRWENIPEGSGRIGCVCAVHVNNVNARSHCSNIKAISAGQAQSHELEGARRSQNENSWGVCVYVCARACVLEKLGLGGTVRGRAESQASMCFTNSSC